MTETMPASWAKRITVDPQTGCWIWSGYIGKFGYGRVTVDRKSWLLHRYTWNLVYGPPPKHMHLHHRCERPACCNPQHLDSVPVAEHRKIHNYAGISAAWEAKRNRTHCSKGHELTPENTRLKPRPEGGTTRLCRICLRVKNVEYKRNAKERRRSP